MSFFLIIFVIALLSSLLVVKNRSSVLFIGSLLFSVNYLIFDFISGLFVISTKDGIIGILSIALILITSLVIILLPRKNGKSIFYIDQNITIAN